MANTATVNKTSFINHSKFLEQLWNAYMRIPGADGDKNIRLVSLFRSNEWLGDMDDDWFGVFIPDFHLLNDDTQDKYPYGFGKLDEARSVDRLSVLDAVIDACEAFKDEAADVDFNLIQLGDLLDLWRERIREDQSFEEIASRIFDLGAFSGSKFYAVMEDIIKILGNHDHEADAIYDTSTWKSYFPRMKNNTMPLFITHGDLFDKLEAMDDGIQKYILNLVQRSGESIDTGVLAQVGKLVMKTLAGDITAHEYPLIEAGLEYHKGTKKRKNPVILQRGMGLDAYNAVNVLKLETDLNQPDLESVRNYHQLLAGYPDKREKPGKMGAGDVIIGLFPKDTGQVQGIIEAIPRIRSGELTPYEKTRNFLLPPGVQALPDLKTVVIGHSHLPRIVTVGEPDGGGFLVVDCGAWLEEVIWPGKKDEKNILPSCQIGVICGNEARIYQLDPVA